MLKLIILVVKGYDKSYMVSKELVVSWQNLGQNLEVVTHDVNFGTVKLQVLTRLVLTHMEAFSDCLFFIHIYCDLLQS